MTSDDRGMTCLLMGSKHAAVGAVCFQTLRDWYLGPITIFVGDDIAEPYANELARAASNCDVRRFEARKQRRNSGYASKPFLPAISPYRYTVQFDLDMGFVGDIEALWPRTDTETVATKYADWITTGRTVSSRIQGFKDVCPDLVKKQLGHSYPAINTGIMGYGNKSVLAREAWLEMTNTRPKAFIVDEIAFQLLWTEFMDVRLLDDRWNYSPLFGTAKGLADCRVIHWHGSGKHLRKEEGKRIWWPMFRRCWDTNFANIRKWAATCGDKWLAAILEDET